MSLNEPKFFCDICNLVLTSKICFDQHLIGSKHKKKLEKIGLENETSDKASTKKNELLNCEHCNLEPMSSSSYLQHINGQKHKKKLKELGLIEDDKKEEFNCDVCEIKLESQEQLTIHLNGKKHIKKLNSTESAKCDVCGIDLKSKEQLVIHQAGKKHLKKLANVANAQPVSETIKAEDDEKFERLNIAWDKYKIDSALYIAMNKKYDFYCSLCNKYMQRKLQLIDHLKSKKHHKKIHERRQKQSGMVNSSSKKPKKINFVPSSSNLQTINENNKNDSVSCLIRKRKLEQLNNNDNNYNSKLARLDQNYCIKTNDINQIAEQLNPQSSQQIFQNMNYNYDLSRLANFYNSTMYNIKTEN